MDELVKTIRKTLIERIASVDADEVAVFLSAGVDSNAVLLAALHAGKKPTAYSWMRDGQRSTDQNSAQRNARALGVPFRSVLLPTDAATLHRLVERLIGQYGCAGKSEIECAMPRLVALEQVEQRVVITGDCADGYFGLSRKAVIAYSKQANAAELDAFRAWYFARANPAQTATIRAICSELGIDPVFPWIDAELLEAFRGWTWAGVNRPRQKEPTRRAFPELSKLAVGEHVNLQLGDSGISKGFDVLLETGDAPKGAKSPIAVYNAIRRRLGR